MCACIYTLDVYLVYVIVPLNVCVCVCECVCVTLPTCENVYAHVCMDFSHIGDAFKLYFQGQSF